MKHVLGVAAALLTVLLFQADAKAHGGTLDRNGGHHNRESRAYHCHRAPCVMQLAQTDAAIQDAEAAHRPYTRLYNRDDWPHWIDADGDCQDTRAEILIQRTQSAVQFKDARRCHVVGGKWVDAYAGKTYTASSQLEIDHIVPLRWAHGHGADKWTRAKRQHFANDRANLQIVGKTLNRSKGAKGPEEWMPPRQQYRCQYVSTFDTLVTRYGLRYVAAEKRVIGRMLSACRTRQGE